MTHYLVLYHVIL